MFDAFFDLVSQVLAFFYSLPVVGGSVGVAIILLTGAVMTLLMPLTIKATKSTIRMQEVQPKLKALQKEYKDDRQTLNAEMMKLYQEHGINPVGGCLPMLAQLPVFLVLFNVLRGLSQKVEDTPFFGVGQHARSMLGGEQINGKVFEPQYLSTDSELYQALHTQTEIKFGPFFDLADRTIDVVRSDFLAGIPYVILILFVVATSYYQQRQISARRSGSMGMNPQQEMILKAMPLLSGVWSFVFPTGLVLYWCTSNVFRIGQQYYITRAFYSGSDGGEATESLTDGEAETDGAGTDGAGTDDDVAEKSPKAQPKSSKSKLKPPEPARTSTNGASGKGATGSGPDGNGATDPADREAAWAQRRKEKAQAAKARAKNRSADSGSGSGSGSGGRVTPKGTKPGGNRAGGTKRKRKR